jgi:alanine transaminase
LLKATGVCVVPGGGFGQEPGTQHIRSISATANAAPRHVFHRRCRTTFLPPEEAMDDVIARMRKFNDELMTKYGA